MNTLTDILTHTSGLTGGALVAAFNIRTRNGVSHRMPTAGPSSPRPAGSSAANGFGDFPAIPAIPAGAGRQVLEVSGYAEEYVDGTPLKFGVLGRMWAMHWHPWLGTLTQLPSAADQRGRGSQ